MAKVSIDSQILEAQRELEMRRRVYANQVREKKLRQGEADLLIGRMEAIIDTLRWVKQHRPAFLEWLAAKTEAGDA